MRRICQKVFTWTEFVHVVLIRSIEKPKMTTHFCELPIGARFAFRGRRYIKLALSMACDEDRWANVFNDGVEVQPDTPGAFSSTCQTRETGRLPQVQSQEIS